jgi:ribosomal protein S10
MINKFKSFQIKVSSFQLGPLKIYIKKLNLFLSKKNIQGMHFKRGWSKKLSLLRSPHVNKKSKEHFERLEYWYILFIKLDLNFIDFSNIYFYIFSVKPESVTAQIIFKM